MNVTELIAACGGDENIRVQALDTCAVSLDWSAKNGTKITFGTEVQLTPNGTKQFGLVIWLDREKVKAALARARGESS